MAPDLDRFFTDPTLFFYSFEGDFVRFVPMTRDSYADSIFFDQRLKYGGQTAYRVPIESVLAYLAERGFAAPRLNFIHHVAQCGSTLLARALDLGKRSLVVREPFHLRQVAVHGGAGFDRNYAPGDWRAMLGLSLTMLGKRFDPAAPVIVKGNVPIGMIGDAIIDADPGQAGILLHFPLDDYCAAILRTDQHRAWLRSVTAELRLHEDPVVGDTSDLGDGALAAALWVSQIKRYERYLAQAPTQRSLDANRLFDEPASTIVAAASLFGIALDAQEADAIVEGPLFRTYAKSPTLDYDPSLRIARREEWKRANGDELSAARRWVDGRAALHGLPDSLDRPLLGERAVLL